VSQMKNGQPWHKFILGRYWRHAVVWIVVLIGLIMAISYFSHDAGKEIITISLVFAVFMTVGNFLSWLVGIKGQWIDSFPKYLKVQFEKNGKEVEEWATDEPLDLISEVDARAHAQQWGRVQNKNGDLPLTGRYKLVDKDVDIKKRWIIYTMKIFLNSDA